MSAVASVVWSDSVSRPPAGVDLSGGRLDFGTHGDPMRDRDGAAVRDPAGEPLRAIPGGGGQCADTVAADTIADARPERLRVDHHR